MNAGSRIVKETDKRLWRILHHYVDNAIAVQDLSHVTKISTDENEVKTISPSLWILKAVMSSTSPKARTLRHGGNAKNTWKPTGAMPRKSPKCAWTCPLRS